MDKIGLFFKINNSLWDLGNRLLAISRIPSALRSSSERKRNSELIQYKNSDRCYILGLGPSLKQVDLSKLDGDTIATNRYFRFDLKRVFSPTYYVLADRAFYGGDAKKELKEAIAQYPESCFVLNGVYFDWCKKELSNDVKPYFFYMWNGGVSARRNMDMTKILPAVNNVVHIAILLALHCGYKEIILLGCDFNSFASPVANHCYKDEKTTRLWDLDYELYAYSLAAHFHVELSKYADANHQRIVNGTKGSLLDAYEFDQDIMDQIYYPNSI